MGMLSKQTTIDYDGEVSKKSEFEGVEWVCGPWIQESLLYFLLKLLLLFPRPIDFVLCLIERLVKPRVVHYGRACRSLEVGFFRKIMSVVLL